MPAIHTRRRFLELVSGGAAALSHAQTGRPPNIVFILADDLGWGDLGCYGNRFAQTPNLDRMAKEGVRFEQFYVASAVCSPSRASFLTGGFTNRHGVHSHYREMAYTQSRGLPPYLDPNLPCLPRLLKQAGYRTAMFGKWHLTASDNVRAPSPAAYGFDRHRVVAGNGDALQRMPLDAPGWAFWPDSRPGPAWNGWRARSSELIINEALDFIGSGSAQPFYIQAWLFDTHGALVPTERQMAGFEKHGKPFRIYYGALADVDRHIGRLLARLEELGIAGNTVLIFSSDNGPEDNIIDNTQEHGVGDPGPFRGRKRSGYEGGIRVPLIVRWPGGAASGRVDRTSVVSAVDFLPTICRLAGAPTPPSTSIDGEDMSEAFRGKPATRRNPLFWDMRQDTVGPLINRSPKLVIRDGRWKLFMHADGTGMELYDMEKSSLEVDNAADAYPRVAQALADRLRKWKGGTASSH
jgi:N-acetylgalactosamine-6-sulfatase